MRGPRLSSFLVNPSKDAEPQPRCVRVLRRPAREPDCSTTTDGSSHTLSIPNVGHVYNEMVVMSRGNKRDDCIETQDDLSYPPEKRAMAYRRRTFDMSVTELNSGRVRLSGYEWLVLVLVLLVIAAAMVVLSASTDKMDAYKPVSAMLTLSIAAFSIMTVMVGYRTIHSAEMVKEGDRQYRQLIEQATDGIFITNKDNLFILVNSKMCEMIGYTEDELHHLTVIDTYPEEMKENARERLALIRSGRSIRFERPLKRKDGSIFHVESSASALGDGRIQAIIHDITDRKQAESAIRESEERLRKAQSISNVGNWEIDLRSKTVWASEEAFRIYGIRQESSELPLAVVEECVLAQYRPAINLAFQRLIARLAEYDEEFEIRRVSDGRLRSIHSKAELVLAQDGTPVKVAGVIQDISDWRQMEIEQRRSVERLRTALGATVQSISRAIESKDPYTAGHQKRTTDLARSIAGEMGLSADRKEFIRIAASIHDIGKISIPAEILSNPRKLTDIEFTLIKAHSQAGYNILKDIEFPWPVAEVILQHHERMDGSGYPNGLEGSNIFLEARILAVADVMEAIASHRPYRPARGIDAALEEIAANKGILYDADVAQACLRLFNERGYKMETFSA
jgi:PAS domain S-box-containing protein/putative nucleotidyltransferase with HDIG domain